MPMLHPNLNPTTLSQPVLHWSRGKNLKGCNMPQQDLLLRAIDMIMSPPPLLHELHWLPIEYRIKFKILLLAYKSLNGKGSVYLKNIFKFRDSPHQLRSVDSLTLEYPRTRTSYGDRAFSIAAAKEWNRLTNEIKSCTSVEIKSCTSVNSFKSQLKTRLSEFISSESSY